MPLSEEELRLLDQMERALAAEDPKFVSTIRGTSIQRAARRRAYLAGAVLVLGMAILLGGAASSQTIIGAIGFVIMLGAAYAGLTSWKGQYATPEQPAQDPGADQAFGLNVIQGGKSGRAKATKPRRTSKPARPQSSGSFLERMEERWRRRKETGGF